MHESRVVRLSKTLSEMFIARFESFELDGEFSSVCVCVCLCAWFLSLPSIPILFIIVLVASVRFLFHRNLASWIRLSMFEFKETESVYECSYVYVWIMSIMNGIRGANECQA